MEVTEACNHVLCALPPGLCIWTLQSCGPIQSLYSLSFVELDFLLLPY